MKKGQDLTGEKFGRLTVIGRTPDKVSPNGSIRKMWKCKCDCGNEAIVWAYSLSKGCTKSCGCLHSESFEDVRSKYCVKHGGYKERLYSVWRDMIERCKNPNERNYKNYGGRGISVCQEWREYEKFREWAIKNGYDENAKRGVTTLDRIDVNGNYSPSNCRWVDSKTQNNNQRRNVLLVVNGEEKTLSQWAEKYGMKPQTIRYRLNIGWSVEDAVTRPRLRKRKT